MRKILSRTFALWLVGLCAVHSAASYGQTVAKPAVFATIASGPQSLTGVSLSAADTWFRWVSDTGIVKLDARLTSQGRSYQAVKAELYVRTPSDSIRRVCVDSLRADSTLHLVAGYMANGDTLFIRIRSLSGICLPCSSAYPGINLTIFNTLSGCPPSVACSLVRNGSFEQPTGNWCGANVAIGADCWYLYENTSDLFRRGCTAGGGQFNLGANTWYSNPVINSHNGAPNNAAAGLLCETNINTNTFYTESIQNLLVGAMMPGHTYELSFWAYNHRGDLSTRFMNPRSYPCWVSFATSPGLLSAPPSGPYAAFPIALNPMADVLVYSVNSWSYYTQTFTYNGPAAMNLLVGPNVYKNYTDGYNNRTDNSMQYVVLDDINLIEKTPLTISPITICAGKTGTLTASGMSTYVWQPGNMTGATVTVNPIVNTVYTVTGTYTGGCTKTQTVLVTVDPLPNISTLQASIGICPGGSATLGATGGTSYTWSPCATGCNLNSLVVSPTVNTTYTVSGMAAGCTNTATTYVYILNPGNSIQVSGYTTICQGDQAYLYASGAGSYTWSPCVSGCNTASLTVSPSASTTYTVRGINACGVLATSTVAVTVKPTYPVNPAVLGNAICSGDAVSLIANGNSPYGYTWNPGNLQGTTISVSPTVTTSYTACTAVPGCATLCAAVTVTVNQRLAGLGIATSTLYPCSGSALTLTAAPVPSAGPYTYTWSPGGANTPTAAFTPTDNAVLSLSASDRCGTTLSSTVCLSVIGTECCLSAETIPANTSIGAGSPYATITGNKWNVSGPLVISGNVTWSNADFRMMSGAKITILPGAKLTLDNCRLFSCRDMWEGITLQAGTALSFPQIELRRSSIEDAYRAIRYDAQNNNWETNVLSSGSLFNKNYIGICIENIAGITNLANSIIVAIDDDFGSQASATSPGKSLKCSGFYAPTLRSRPYAGVYFNNQNTDLHLGDAGFNPANANSYDNMDFGIHLHNSISRVFKSSFSNMSGPGLVAFPPPGGSGICTTNSFPSAGHVVHVEQCSFSNVNKGLDVSGNGAYEVFDCQFGVGAVNPSVYGTAAIYAANVSHMANARGNSISNFDNGIVNAWSAPVAAANFSLSVFQNTITAAGTAAAYCGQAITLSDAVNTFSTTGRNLVISSNQISTVQNGIAVTNVKFNLRISNNSIGIQYAASGTRTGIRLNGTNNASLDNNSVSSSATANAALRGIHLQLSPNCLTQCNTVSNTGQAFVFEGNCLTGNAGFVNNTINNAYDGLVLKNNGVIGQQGFYNALSSASRKTTHNQWLGSYGNSKTLVMDAGSSATNSKMYVMNTPGELPAPQNLNKTNGVPGVDNYGTSATNSPASLLTQANGPVACPGPNTTGFRQAAPDSSAQALSKALADSALYALTLGPGPEAVLAEESRELGRAYVFGLLAGGYSGMHRGLQRFYTAQRDSLPGSQHDIDSLIAQQAYAQALSLNAGLPPAGAIARNQQLLNTALLRSLEAPAGGFGEAVWQELWELAAKCPLSAGTAVYQARSLLGVLAGTVLHFDDPCENQQGKRLGRSGAGPQELFSLYPNPGRGLLSLRYTLGRDAWLELYDLSGRLLLQQLLDKNAGSLALETGLAEGLYLYTVRDGQGRTIRTDKLVIIP